MSFVCNNCWDGNEVMQLERGELRDQESVKWRDKNQKPAKRQICCNATSLQVVHTSEEEGFVSGKNCEISNWGGDIFFEICVSEADKFRLKYQKFRVELKNCTILQVKGGARSVSSQLKTQKPKRQIGSSALFFAGCPNVSRAEGPQVAIDKLLEQ